jgi:hypothetical protein
MGWPRPGGAPVHLARRPRVLLPRAPLTTDRPTGGASLLAALGLPHQVNTEQ